MARVVYIFGAGASHSMGTPLLANFIDAADDLRKARQDISVEAFELIFNVLNERLPVLHAKSNQDIQNIETVFNLIEMGMLLNRFPGTDPKDIPDLSRAIRTVLAETIELTCNFKYDTNERKWSPPAAYNTLIDNLFGSEHYDPKSAALVTFNYDLGLEVALFLMGRSFDYGFHAPVARAIPLLKLHGSLNWTRCDKCNELRAIPLDKIFAEQGTPRSRVNSAGILRQVRVKPFLSSLPPHCADAPTLGIPALVPPSWNKTQYHAAFRQIWARTAKELSEAEEIYIIGYSYPDADAFFHALVALGLAGGSRVRVFEVIDPNKAVGERVSRLLGPETTSRFRYQQKTFEDWVTPLRRSLRSRILGPDA